MPEPVRRSTALGCHIFAGGFTVGVSKRFRVLAHLEDGPFGVATVKANFPNLEIHQNPTNWPIHRYKDMVDLVYCNPSCAPWSTAGIVRGQTTVQQNDWASHPGVKGAILSHSLLSSVRPKVWVMESVRQMHSKGRALTDRFAMVARDLGYSVTDLLVEGRDFGLAQRRKRYFMVCHRVAIDWIPPRTPERGTLEVLTNVDPADDLLAGVPSSVAAIMTEVGPGKGCRATWDRLVKEGRHPGTPRPAFIYDRMATDTPSYTLLGSCNKLHPTEDRMLSVNESKVLCGFPPDYRFVGNIQDRYAQIGKGVCPPVAEWLAGCLADAIRQDRPVGPYRRLTVTVRPDHIFTEETPDAPAAESKDPVITPDRDPITAVVTPFRIRPKVRRPG